jgi:hypothetical protein
VVLKHQALLRDTFFLVDAESGTEIKQQVINVFVNSVNFDSQSTIFFAKNMPVLTIHLEMIAEVLLNLSKIVLNLK